MKRSASMASLDIDWAALARNLGMVHVGQDLEKRTIYGGTEYARRALEMVLGPDKLRAAVDTYVEAGDGAELVRSVLWLLHPWSSMERCHEIYGSTARIERRRAAIELLRVAADHRALPWVRHYLDDPDPEIRSSGVGILDQLLFARLVDEAQCAELLAHARQHADPLVREKVAEIDEHQLGRKPHTNATNEAD
jgi:hypothetical protein